MQADGQTDRQAKIITNQIFFYPRALIRSGSDAGRITDIADGTGSFDINVFKDQCCGNLCSRYEDKRPLSLVAADTGGTCSKPRK